MKESILCLEAVSTGVLLHSEEYLQNLYVTSSPENIIFKIGTSDLRNSTDTLEKIRSCLAILVLL